MNLIVPAALSKMIRGHSAFIPVEQWPRDHLIPRNAIGSLGRNNISVTTAEYPQSKAEEIFILRDMGIDPSSEYKFIKPGDMIEV